MRVFLVALLLLLLSIVASSAAPVAKPNQKKPVEVAKGEKFVEALLAAIDKNSEKKIGELIDDDFLFEGCKRKYTKADTVKLLLAISPQLADVVEHHTKIVSLGSRKYTATISDYFLPMSVEFVASDTWKLHSGKTRTCGGGKQ